MATPPSKRRRTSPMTSISANAPRTPPRQTSPSRGGARSTPNRASFLSPTKASLSRSHPGLLPRALPDDGRRPGSKRGEGLPNGGIAPRDVAGNNEDNSAAPARLDEPPVRRSPRGVTNGGIGAPPRRRSRTPGGRASSPIKAVVETAAVLENRPEANANAQTLVDNIEKAAVNGSVEHSDLPPFPRADPVASRPPAGLEYSPSQRPARNSGLAERLKSSPLKPKQVQSKSVTTEDRLDRERQNQQVEPRASLPIEHISTIREDPLILRKRARRDELLRQVQSRRRQIDRLEKEILRQQADSVSSNQRNDKKSAERLV